MASSMPNYRNYYIPILIIQCILAIVVANKYSDLTQNTPNLATYIGTNVSLYALLLAILEILMLRSLSQTIALAVEETKIAIYKLEDVKNLSEVISTIAYIRNEIINEQYPRAILSIGNILKVYIDVVESDELLDINSIHRANVDNMHSMINKLEVV